MRRIAIPAALGLALALGGCQTQKSRHACQLDVERLKDASAETGLYLEALRPELKAGFKALAACDVRFKPCEAEAWLARAEAMREEHLLVKAEFSNAVNKFWPDACLPYTRSYRLNPPDPQTYKGYFYTLEDTGEQIDELIQRFDARVPAG